MVSLRGNIVSPRTVREPTQSTLEGGTSGFSEVTFKSGFEGLVKINYWGEIKRKGKLMVHEEAWRRKEEK